MCKRSLAECGSGVIFKKDAGVFYALTAAHVVSVENAQLLVFTVNTEMKTEVIPGVDYAVLTRETYESMYQAKIEYVSTRDDLAVISLSASRRAGIFQPTDRHSVTAC